jgi:hypothetical protein
MHVLEKQRGFAGILGLVIVLAIIGLLAAYFYGGGVGGPGRVSSGVGTLSGAITFFPPCPTEPGAEPCPQNVGVFTNRSLTATSLSTGATKHISVDASGVFSTELPSGPYLVSVSLSGIETAKGFPKQISIGPGQNTELIVQIDTGVE